MSGKREIVGALERRTPDEERLKAAWEEMDDWKGRCRRCGRTFKGKIKAIQAHDCPGKTP